MGSSRPSHPGEPTSDGMQDFYQRPISGANLQASSVTFVRWVIGGLALPVLAVACLMTLNEAYPMNSDAAASICERRARERGIEVHSYSTSSMAWAPGFRCTFSGPTEVTITEARWFGYFGHLVTGLGSVALLYLLLGRWAFVIAVGSGGLVYVMLGLLALGNPLMMLMCTIGLGSAVFGIYLKLRAPRRAE
ncbi:MAG TPA: hypothetical protein VE174_03565 [Actinomycetota bacterium]|nr:hypothetical protein [Actinomycetota bacterium]